MKHPLIIHPYFSDATAISTKLASHLIDWFYFDRNIQTFDVPGFHARPRTLIRTLHEMRMRDGGGSPLIIYVGHGHDDAWLGYEYHTILDRLLGLPSNVLLDTSKRLVNYMMINNLKNSIIVSIACRTLSALGPFLIKHGVKAYLGSTENMNVSLEDYNQDDILDIYDLYSTPVKTLALGGTVREAAENTRALAAKYQSCCGRLSEGTREECNELFSLVRDNYGYVGDGDARWIIPEVERQTR